MFRGNRYRRFSRDERALLEELLRRQEPGFDVLREQLGVASYKHAWFPGAVSFDIHLDGEVPRYPMPSAGSSTDGVIVAARDVFRGGAAKVEANQIGSVLLWVDDGRIAALEYAWTTDRMPSSLPSVSQLGD